MKYKAVLFDMDGTVLNTIGDIANAVNHSLEHFGHPVVPESQVLSSIGNGARRLMQGCAPAGLSDDAFELLLNYYNTWYNDHSILLTCPYPGIPELTASLIAAGVRVAIISNKPDPTVKGLAERFFPGIYAVGECPGIRRKPAPDAVLSCLADFGVDRSDAVYIGDTEVDIATSANAGLDCIAVSWGFRSREHLASSGAAVICDRVEQLTGLLLS